MPECAEFASDVSEDIRGEISTCDVPGGGEKASDAELNIVLY